MAVPASYTEETLKSYMVAVLGGLAGVLSLTADDMAEAVNDTLLAYGADTVAEVTEIAKLRALARVAAWQVAVDASAGSINFRANNAQFDRARIHEDAKAGLARAEAGLVSAGYGAGPVVTVSSFTYTGEPFDPASYYEDEE